VDHRGIFVADVVFVPLEDGDRTEELVRLGKRVITVDLNPLSRTAQLAEVTIVDNVVRAMPLLVTAVRRLRKEAKKTLEKIVTNFDNQQNLSEAIQLINEHLTNLAENQNRQQSRNEQK
jgi:4-phosphopantoate--beta-alanine ligase